MSEWKPIGSRIPSHFDAGRIAGLREAAEMLAKLMSDTDFEYTDNPSSVRQMVEDKQAELNARIAELEKP